MRNHALIAQVSNPWPALAPTDPYILEEDTQAVLAFNRGPHAGPDVAFHLDLLPEPFLGNPTAPIVLLNLNPGFDASEDPHWHAVPEFRDLSRANLRHDPSLGYPFFLLDPRLAASGGGKWWRKRLRPLLETCGQEAVSTALLCVEYLPYHSRHFSGRTPQVPSQRYAFSLVQSAVDRGAVIIALRSAAKWHAAVPALASYHRSFVIRTPKRGTAPFSPMLFPGWLHDLQGRAADYSLLVDAVLASTRVPEQSAGTTR
jgi:hypothetical protein